MPAYNEEAGIRAVLVEARSALAARCARFEIVVVDDGSTDATGDLLARATSAPEIVVLTHSRTLGYSAALSRGLRAARFDPVLYTDSDGQFDLADLDRALPLLTGEIEMVAGYRERRADPWIRKTASAGFNFLARLLLGVRARDVDCAFKLFRRSFLERLTFSSDGFLIDAEIYARARLDGVRYRQLPVRHRARTAGRSSIRWSVVGRSLRELLELRRALRTRPLIADATLRRAARER